MFLIKAENCFAKNTTNIKCFAIFLDKIINNSVLDASDNAVKINLE